MEFNCTQNVPIQNLPLAKQADCFGFRYCCLQLSREPLIQTTWQCTFLGPQQFSHMDEQLVGRSWIGKSIGWTVVKKIEGQTCIARLLLLDWDKGDSVADQLYGWSTLGNGAAWLRPSLDKITFKVEGLFPHNQILSMAKRVGGGQNLKKSDWYGEKIIFITLSPSLTARAGWFIR